MKNVSIQSAKLSYTDRIAHTLIHFAEKNPSFLSWFVDAIPIYSSTEYDVNYSISYTKLHEISNEQLAVRKALWLLDKIQNIQTRENRKTHTMLSEWKKEQDQDEVNFIVLGIKYGVLDYGIVGHPKRFHEPLDIVIREDIANTKKSTTLVKESLNLGMSIVEQALVSANGIVGKLEPELHDWLFGEKNVVLHTCTKKTITKLAQEAKEIGYPTASRTDEQGLSILALSPAVYINDLQYSTELKTFE